jgi:hypothetical protein
MQILIPWLWTAGLVQIAIAAANFLLPKKLRYRQNLEKVEPFIRQVFIVHSAYIVGVLLLFAAVTLGFAPELSSGRGLGRFLAACMAMFWVCRVPLQLLYYDRALRRAHRLGDLAFIAAALFLVAAYGAAALVHVA